MQITIQALDDKEDLRSFVEALLACFAEYIDLLAMEKRPINSDVANGFFLLQQLLLSLK